MKGVPKELQYVTLNKVLSRMPKPSSLIFTNLFDSVEYPSDQIRWLLEYGTAGISPFVAPGAPSPVMGDDGMFGEGSAACAYWKEKVFLEEVMLNNMKDPMNPTVRQTARRQLARKQKRLKNRSMRRREWMLAKAFFDHKINYQREGGVKFTVDYGVPDSHQVTLTGDDVWNDGTGSPGATATPIRDIYDMKKEFVDDVGVNPTDFFINSELLTTLLFNTDLQDLLKKSNFGDGDLFARPAQVLGNLLGLGSLTIYDDLFELGAWMTQDVASGSTDIHIDDATDFEAGARVRLFDLTKYRTWEDYVIDSVDILNNTITLTSAVSKKYTAGRCRVVMRKKLINDTTVGMFARSVDDEKIAEFMEAPFGLGRHFGLYADTKEEWDPDGIWMRVQNKGLPVIYHPEALYTLTVG